MSAWPPCLLSQKKPSWAGGGGSYCKKLLPQKGAEQLPARLKNKDFCSAAGWERTAASVQHKHHLKKCEAGHLSKLQEILEEGSDTESDLKETLYAPLMQYLFRGLISIQSLPGCPFPSCYPQCDR